MAEDATTPLQDALAKAISASGKARDYFDTLYKQRTGKSGKPIYDIMRGESRQPKPDTLRIIGEVMGLEPERLVRIVYGQQHPELVPEGSIVPVEADYPAMVEIQSIDLAYGLGATFTDSAISVDVMQFPKAWVEGITSSPTNLLTWARGRGDSMEPTIRDGDMVLLDRSQSKVQEQDAIWAFTVGDLAQIKRLRRKGSRMVILSDNPAVPDDEEPIDLVNVVARVVFIGHRS